MDEIYRTLGSEHEADLEREARKWRRADVARRLRHASAPARHEEGRITRRLLTRQGRAASRCVGRYRLRLKAASLRLIVLLTCKP
jgi:hypothetical protein